MWYLNAEEGMTRETERIQFLLERGGREATREWVREMLDTYRHAIETQDSHAATRHYRPSFEQSIRELKQWLDQEEGRDE